MKTDTAYAWGEGVFTLLSWFKTQKVSAAKVMVAGAGALGNEVVKNLALFGVGNIVIVDFDTIERSNLTRSVLFRETDARKSRFKAKVLAQRAKQVNPYIRTTAICGDLASEVGLGLYKQMDVIIGCLDSRYARYLLNAMAFRAGKPWVDGAIENLDGTVRVFRPEANCYECGLTSDEFESIMLKTGCADVVQTNRSFGRIATTPISASLIGAVQVQEAMKIIHQEELESGAFTSLLGKMFKYEGMRFSSKVFKHQTHYPDCPAHENWTQCVELKHLGSDVTVKNALAILKEELGVREVEINLRNNKFIEKIISRTDEQEFPVLLPESRLGSFIDSHEVLKNLRYKDILYQKKCENIDSHFPYQNFTLKRIGIPCFDIIQVATEKGIFYVELTKDRIKYNRVLSD